MFNIFKAFESNELINAENALIKINNLENQITKLNDIEIKEQITKLIRHYQQNQDLNAILAESFALTREVSKRKLGLRHFDSQILGGCILNEGKIAEMKTGEGKTLVATLPTVLNALTLQGSHVVTVNDYLAKRDEQWMGQIYRGLGLSVGLIQEGMNQTQRKLSYAADITYVTNSELAFDYLRDNMSPTLTEIVQRPYNFCIVDEVDSILIDEARTPLIISESQEVSIEKYVIADEIAKYLKANQHYLIDEKQKNVTLTDTGIKQVETLLQTQDLYNVNDPWIPYINNALKANTLFLRDTNYIVKENEILIIDEFTGRIMPDRRWGDGLHQAIEAKEKATIKPGSETLGSITYQNFFKLYPKLSGMTGTAKTASAEFEKIYNLEVVIIPTAKPIKRNDATDLIYQDDYTKWKKIASECQKLYTVGQPCLIGTVTIEKSEIISQLLSELNVPHQLLNAKPENIKRESEIIAQAGCFGAVTVATNMAGRGTDILLGGNSKFQSQQELKLTILKLIQKQPLNQTEIKQIYRIFKRKKPSEFYKWLFSIKKLKSEEIEQIVVNIEEGNSWPNTQKLIFQLYNEIFKQNDKEIKIEREKVKTLGGLYVIGTERHESKRIDNQLRGRSGRQGDPGTARFFLSLDDNLLRVFSGETIKNIMNTLNLNDEALESPALTTSLDNAQQKVENYFYETRKQLFEYDEVLNIQRLSIFKERRAILEAKSVKNEFIHYGEMLMLNYEQKLEEKSFKTAQRVMKELGYFLEISLPLKTIINKNLNNELKKLFWIRYDLKEAEFETYQLNLIRILEKDLLLIEIDKNWKQHLKELDILKDSIRWRGYGQFNPLSEYKKEGYNLFVETIQKIKYNSVYNLMKSKFS